MKVLNYKLVSWYNLFTGRKQPGVIIHLQRLLSTGRTFKYCLLVCVTVSHSEFKKGLFENNRSESLGFTETRNRGSAR